jgi:hypothetical protein
MIMLQQQQTKKLKTRVITLNPPQLPLIHGAFMKYHVTLNLLQLPIAGKKKPPFS